MSPGVLMEIRLLVSVIVPVQNGEPYIGMALDSALLQTYRDIEIIVVDDGFSDGELHGYVRRPSELTGGC